MLLEHLLCEHLGNLSQLKLGKLADVFRQNLHTNKHNEGRASPNGREFTTYKIGSTAKVIDAGKISDIAALRKAYRTHEDDEPAAFALYIDGHAVAVGIFDYDDLRAPSTNGLLAFDLSKYDADKDDNKSETSREETDYSKKFDEKTGYAKVTKRYTGRPVRSSSLSTFIERVHKLADGKPVTVKLVARDTEKIAKALARARTRDSNKEILTGLEALKTRLIKYKLSKKPTAATIEDFVKETLLKKNQIVQFAGKSYKTEPEQERIDTTGLLNGKPFELRYRAADPDDYFSSIYVHYVYDPEDRTLVPFKAVWGSRSKSVPLDAKKFLKNELRVDPDNKDATLRAILSLVKKESTAKARQAIEVVRSLGHDYPEFKAIEKSLNATAKADDDED